MVKDRFDNIGVAITNNGEGIDLNLIDESKKKTYKEIIGGDDNA